MILDFNILNHMQLKFKKPLLKKFFLVLTKFKIHHPKFFYDQKGSELFEEICSLPEYYPTRTEISILKKFQDELSSEFLR